MKNIQKNKNKKWEEHAKIRTRNINESIAVKKMERYHLKFLL